MRYPHVPDEPTAWPGVFRPLRHWVLPDARRMRAGGGWAYFAVCGCPCWPPDLVGHPPERLPWCATCATHRQRRAC